MDDKQLLDVGWVGDPGQRRYTAWWLVLAMGYYGDHPWNPGLFRPMMMGWLDTGPFEGFQW